MSDVQYFFIVIIVAIICATVYNTVDLWVDKTQQIEKQCQS